VAIRDYCRCGAIKGACVPVGDIARIRRHEWTCPGCGLVWVDGRLTYPPSRRPRADPAPEDPDPDRPRRTEDDDRYDQAVARARGNGFAETGGKDWS
jgi:hypothetical protein